MPYHAAIGPALAAACGLPFNGTLHITCESCPARVDVLTRRGSPAAWFIRQRNPPGWRLSWPEGGTVIAYCLACAKLGEAT